MSYRLTLFAAALALALFIIMLSEPQREASAPAVPVPLHDPGYSARKARLVQTGADGQPIYTLDAAQIQQQPDSGLIDMQQVQFGFRDANGNAWTARALRGELAENSGVVQLDGDVHVNGTLPGTEDPATFLSEHVTFDTHTQVVATHDPVTLVTSGRELKAIGMVASLKERHVQLESAVHGSFLP
jgi:LPS export ABC transporter protein LptC